MEGHSQASFTKRDVDSWTLVLFLCLYQDNNHIERCVEHILHNYQRILFKKQKGACNVDSRTTHRHTHTHKVALDVLWLKTLIYLLLTSNDSKQIPNIPA